MAKTKKASRKKLEDTVEALGTEVRHLSSRIEKLAEAVSKWVTCPGEAMNLLTGELRAFRLLLDQKGEYNFMDRAHAALSPAPPATPRKFPEKSAGNPGDEPNP